MRYDDVLHGTFMEAIGGMLSNPVNSGINQNDLIDQAWSVAVAAATKAKAFSVMRPRHFTYAIAAAPADDAVTTPGTGITLNSLSKTEIKSIKPTTVQNANGDFITG